MLSYPLRLAFQRVRVICKIRNYFLFAVLRDSKCIRAPPVASELFDTSCAVWVSQTITSFLEIKYQNKENNRQWVSGIDPANYEIFGIAYPIAFTRFCMPIICHSTNSKTDFKQLSVNNSSSTLTQLVVQEKNKQEAGIYAIIIGY
jgi:hypothetical protein